MFRLIVPFGWSARMTSVAFATSGVWARAPGAANAATRHVTTAASNVARKCFGNDLRDFIGCLLLLRDGLATSRAKPRSRRLAGARANSERHRSAAHVAKLALGM